MTLTMFRIVTTSLTTLSLLIHAIGGCCWHHAHGGRWLFGTVSGDQCCQEIAEATCEGCCREAHPNGHSHDSDDESDGIHDADHDTTEQRFGSGHDSNSHSCLCCAEGRCVTVIERRDAAGPDLSAAFVASHNLARTSAVNEATPVAAWRQFCLARLSTADLTARSQSALQVWLI